MKAIIFGSTGYIGRHLVSKLLDLQWELELYGLSRNASIHGVSVESVNVANMDELRKIDFNVDFIFFFAGLNGPTQSYSDYKDFVISNEIGLLNVLTMVSRVEHSKPQIIYPSSRLVYRGFKNIQIKENSILEAKSIYAKNKISAEMILKLFSDSYGINYTIFRIGVPYGDAIEGGPQFGTVGNFVKSAINKKVIVIFGDGTQRRTFTHVEDLCWQIIYCILQKKSRGQIYNIIGENLSLLEVAEILSKKYKVPIVHKDFDDFGKKIESGDTIFDSTKLSLLLGGYDLLSFTDWVGSDLKDFS